MITTSAFNSSQNSKFNDFQNSKSENLNFPKSNFDKKLIPIKSEIIKCQFKNLCKTHLKKQEAYCKKCNQAVCINCLLDSFHKSHLIESFECIFKKEQKNLDIYYQELLNLANKITNDINGIELKSFESRLSLDEKIQRISAAVENVKKQLNAKMSHLENHVTLFKKSIKAKNSKRVRGQKSQILR